MEERAHAIIAGLFTILLIIAVIAAYWWLSGTGSERNDYYVVSDQPVTGLNAQATVKFRGVSVGQVSSIEFDPINPLSILIKISVDKKLRLTRGAYAQLKLQGLTGLAYIELNDSGKNSQTLALAEEGKERIPLNTSDMDNLIDSGKQLAERSRVLVENSIRLVEGGRKLFEQRNIERIEQILTNLDQATRELKPLLASVTQASQRVNGMFSEEHQQRVLSIADHANDALRQVEPLVQDMRRAAAGFHDLSAQLQRSGSEISDRINDETLPRLNQLTIQLTQDAKHLDTLMQELQQNPQSLIFGKPQLAPGPGEPGFKAQ
jgi:phospholipid/cholesterol/gamma-HCH transport system substrate-binding protein